MSRGRSVTQDPIEQALEKLGSLGIPVTDIGEKVSGLTSQLGSFDLFEMVDQVGGIDPSQFDIQEILSELYAKFEELDPALKVPVAIAAGFIGARIMRYIIR